MASVVQVILGVSGLIGIVIKYIGPLVITPTVVLVALPLFGPAAQFASKHWWIAIT